LAARVLLGVKEATMTKILNIVPDRCTGCMQCELACSWVQTGTFAPSKSVIRVNVFDEEASYAPYTCLQCDEAWCMSACPVNAIAIDNATGAKVVIEASCIGCHLCTIACPFGTVFTTPKSDTAAKCNLCGGDPACAAACPTAAIEYVEADKAGGWFEPWTERVNSSYVEAAAGSN
jgi:carbon-monoxide dehydrogenase iron sulfur subunit